LGQYGDILSEQSAIASESMRVLSAKNWVGFIKRSRDDLIPKISNFCNRRDLIMELKLPDSISNFEKWNLETENETKELLVIGFLQPENS